MELVTKALNLWFIDEKSSTEIRKELNIDTQTIRRWVVNHEKGPKEINGHVHRWVLESPNGKASLGHCKECRSTKYYYNSIDSLPNDWMTKRQRSQLIGAYKGGNSKASKGK
tara:strand:+ start:454 stop:789 length:336 start_codon:yes stop_codon:yes gene_type:complete